MKKRPVLQIRRQLRSAEEDCQCKLDDRKDAEQSRAAQQWRRRPGTTARRLCAAGAGHRTNEKAGEWRDDPRCGSGGRRPPAGKQRSRQIRSRVEQGRTTPRRRRRSEEDEETAEEKFTQRSR